MKLFELFSQSLEEGGIKTAKIDAAAYEALSKKLRTVIKDIIAKAEEEVPPKKLRSDAVDDNDYDTSKHYDNVYQIFYKEPNRLVVPICMEAGKILGMVTRSHLHEIKDTLGTPEKVKSLRWVIEDVRVKVEARENSSDSYKDYGGYFSSGENMLKVFVNKDQVYNAAMELVAVEILGESEREGYLNLTKTIVPIFVHEYAHLEQNLRTKKDVKDFGYITVGVGGRSGKGKRGGYIRSPRDGLSAYLRYKGNLDEIDSFASEAVAELMHEFHSTPEWRSKDIDREVRNIMDNISTGYASSKTYDHYVELLRNTFDGAYDEVGLSREQMEMVWKRFAKRVYQKLQDYLSSKTGKAKDAELERINPEWAKLLKLFPMRDAIRSIAYSTAGQIFNKSYIDLEGEIDRVREGISAESSKGEHFIDMYYFGYNFDDKPSQLKLKKLFRELVVRSLKEIRQQEQDIFKRASDQQTS